MPCEPFPISRPCSERHHAQSGWLSTAIVLSKLNKLISCCCSIVHCSVNTAFSSLLSRLMWALPLSGVFSGREAYQRLHVQTEKHHNLFSKNRVTNFYVESIEICHSAVTRHWIACYFNLLHSCTPYEKSTIDHTLAKTRRIIRAITTFGARYRDVKAGGKCRVFVRCFAML
jgi:hypothetical protein